MEIGVFFMSLKFNLKFWVNTTQREYQNWVFWYCDTKSRMVKMVFEHCFRLFKFQYLINHFKTIVVLKKSFNILPFLLINLGLFYWKWNSVLQLTSILKFSQYLFLMHFIQFLFEMEKWIYGRWLAP